MLSAVNRTVISVNEESGRCCNPVTQTQTSTETRETSALIFKTLYCQYEACRRRAHQFLWTLIGTPKQID